MSATFRALDTNVEVVADDAEVLDLVAALTATYGPALGRATLCYRFECEHGRLFRNNAMVCDGVLPIDLAPVFELDLHRQLLERSLAKWILHAAALAHGDGGRALVLVGASGSGKSTLSTALIERGALYMSDECVVVDGADMVTGLARPISLTHDRPPLGTAAFTSRVYPFRLPDGGLDQTTLLHPSPPRVCHGSRFLGSIVHLRYAPRERPGLQRLSSGQALAVLWPQSRSSDGDALSIALGVVERRPVFALTTRAIDEACAQLDECW